jgi:hypothetical protein
MFSGDIDSELRNLEWAEVARLADQPEAKLHDWVRREVIELRHAGPDARTVIAAAAAGALAANNVDDDFFLSCFVKLMSNHLMFHCINQCARAIEAKQWNRRGVLVRAPRYLSMGAEVFSDTVEVEPYRYVLLVSGISIRLTARKGTRFPDGYPPETVIDMKQLGKEIAQRVREPLITTIFTPDFENGADEKVA